MSSYNGTVPQSPSTSYDSSSAVTPLVVRAQDIKRRQQERDTLVNASMPNNGSAVHGGSGARQTSPHTQVEATPLVIGGDYVNTNSFEVAVRGAQADEDFTFYTESVDLGRLFDISYEDFLGGGSIINNASFGQDATFVLLEKSHFSTIANLCLWFGGFWDYNQRVLKSNATSSFVDALEKEITIKIAGGSDLSAKTRRGFGTDVHMSNITTLETKGQGVPVITGNEGFFGDSIVKEVRDTISAVVNRAVGSLQTFNVLATGDVEIREVVYQTLKSVGVGVPDIAGVIEQNTDSIIDRLAIGGASFVALKNNLDIFTHRLTSEIVNTIPPMLRIKIIGHVWRGWRTTVNKDGSVSYDKTDLNLDSTVEKVTRPTATRGRSLLEYISTRAANSDVLVHHGLDIILKRAKLKTVAASSLQYGAASALRYTVGIVFDTMDIVLHTQDVYGTRESVTLLE